MSDRSNHHPRAGLVAIIFTILAILLILLANLDLQVDQITLTKVGGSAYMSPWTLAMIRVCFSVLGVIVVVGVILDPIGLKTTVIYRPGSLLEAKPIHITGPARLSTFTVQCWTLETLYFTSASVCSVLLATGSTVAPHAVLMAVWFMYETSVVCSMLVTFITTFVLIPEMVRKGREDGIKVFFGWRAQCMHNLNVVFMFFELVMNGLPCLLTHIPISVLWGLHYIVFSWWWLRYSTYGIVYYFFLDPTLPLRKSAVFHIGLLSVFIVFFGFAVTINAVPVPARVVLLCIGTCLITWTRLHGVPKVNKPETAQQ